MSNEPSTHDNRKRSALWRTLPLLAMMLVAVVGLGLMLGARQDAPAVEEDPYGEAEAAPAPAASAPADDDATPTVNDPAATHSTSSAPVGRVLESSKVGEPYNQRISLIDRGRAVYNRYCVGCHGVDGDGKGPAAQRLVVLPRDFTTGIYKFRSTDSGSLPLDTDLHRTITKGLARVSMPAFPLMAEQDRVAVIQYIKTFYPKWEAEKDNRKVVYVPRAPQDLTDPQRVGRGRVVYLAMGCANCHGSDGAGTGATAKYYTDAWGHTVRAFNFTKGRLKGGDDPEDVYRTFHTGLRSVMPAFGGQTLAFVSQEQALASMHWLDGEKEQRAASLAEFPKSTAEIGAMDNAQREEQAVRNSWDLVAYVQSLRQSPSPEPAPVK